MLDKKSPPPQIDTVILKPAHMRCKDVFPKVNNNKDKIPLVITKDREETENIC